jgi:hypothetical protein
MNQRACPRTRFREQSENSKIGRVMFLDILNRRAASGVHTAHSRGRLPRELPKLENRKARTPKGRLIDSAARCHLGNVDQ